MQFGYPQTKRIISNSFFYRYINNCVIEITRKQLIQEEEVEEDRREQVGAQHNDDFIRLQPNEHKEYSNSQLAPAQKARLLRNAVRWFNGTGFLNKRNWVIERDYIEIGSASVNCAKKFFASRKNLCVWDVLQVIQFCAAAVFDELQPGDGEYDKKWHVRNGLNVCFLLKYWDKVNEQLNLE